MLYLNVRGSEAMKFKVEVEERPREQTWIPLKNRMEYSLMLQLPLPCLFSLSQITHKHLPPPSIRAP